METAILLIVLTLVLVGGGLFRADSGKCQGCGYLLHGISFIKEVDAQKGEAYHVCKKCGHRHVSGYVRDDNQVGWYGGGSGEIDSDGIYHDHSQASGSYDGDGGGFGGFGGGE